eukprot:56898-Chlamydomonas_euryale.AAC.1
MVGDEQQLQLDLKLCNGPDRCVEKSDRAVIQGSEWCTERVENDKKACDSLVMIKSETGIEVGRVQSFYL